MSIKKVFSTSLLQPINLNYRMPSDSGVAPVITISLPERAFNVAVYFNSQEHYEAFKRQNQRYFDKKMIFEGVCSNDKELKHSKNERAKEQSQAIRDKTDRETQKVQEVAEQAGSKMKVVVSEAQK